MVSEDEYRSRKSPSDSLSPSFRIDDEAFYTQISTAFQSSELRLHPDDSEESVTVQEEAPVTPGACHVWTTAVGENFCQICLRCKTCVRNGCAKCKLKARNLCCVSKNLEKFLMYLSLCLFIASAVASFCVFNENSLVFHIYCVITFINACIWTVPYYWTRQSRRFQYVQHDQQRINGEAPEQAILAEKPTENESVVLVVDQTLADPTPHAHPSKQ